MFNVLRGLFKKIIRIQKELQLRKTRIQNNANYLFRKEKISDVIGVMSKRIDTCDNFFSPRK